MIGGRWPLERLGGWGVLAVGLVAALVAGWLAPPIDRTTEEVTYRMAAESLAFDFDLELGEEDLARFAAHDWGEGTRLAVVQTELETPRFARPGFYPLALAPFVRLAGDRGRLVFDWLLLALVTVLVGRGLESRVGPQGPWLASAFVFGSALFALPWRDGPETLWLAAVVLAVYLTRRSWSRDETAELEDMYTGASSVEARGLVWWFAAGALLAIVAAEHPFFLLLAVAVGGAALSERWAAWPMLALGLTLGLLLAWWTGGLWGAVATGEKLVLATDTVSSIGQRGPSPLTSIDKAFSWPPILEPALLGWNALYLLVGRHVGLILFFPALLLVVATSSGSGAFRRSAPVVLAVLAAFVLFHPFNFYGGPWSLGNRWFVPLYGLLLLAAIRPVRPAIALVVAVVGGVVVALLAWGEGGVVGHLRQRLPFETSQRQLPIAGEVAQQGLTVRATSATIGPSKDGRELAIERGRWGELLILADERVDSVRLGFDGRAKGEPELRGGSLGSTMFRPDGGIVYEVRLEDRFRRHSTWASEGPQNIYRLGLKMTEGETESLAFGVSR